LISAATPIEAAVAIESRYGANGGRELDLVVAKASGEPLLFKGMISHARMSLLSSI
jgi:hypothetical protein